MNRFLEMTLFALLLVAFSATAGQQEELDQVMEAIRRADKLAEEGKERQAIAEYQLAQKTLIQFQKANPEWDKQRVSSQLIYVNKRVDDWNGAQFTRTVSDSNPTAESLQNRVNYLERSNQQYQFQLKQLHDENARLGAKLREALALRPAAQEPAVVAETQAQLEKLQIDFATMNDRAKELQKELSEYPEPEVAKKNVQLLAETRKNLNQVIAEAEELRRTNEILRKETATRPVTTRGGSEALYKETLAAQAAQQLAESEVGRLRQENENLNRRLASLEDRLSAASLAQSSPGTPQLNKIDSARLALSKGESAEASRLLTEALTESPNNVELLHLMGRALILENKTGEAEVILKKVLELAPDSGVTHFELARLYFSMDTTNVGLARWHYHKALNLGFPRNGDFEKNIHWEQPGG